jgi:hypothetical protein
MEWKNKGGVVVCTMDGDEFESLLETLVEARDSTVPLSRQNFPADYAGSLLDSMSAMERIEGWEPWTPEEDTILEEAWRSWGQALSHRAFMQRLRADAPHPVLATRTERAVALHLAKLGLVKGRRPKEHPTHE